MAFASIYPNNSVSVFFPDVSPAGFPRKDPGLYPYQAVVCPELNPSHQWGGPNEKVFYNQHDSFSDHAWVRRRSNRSRRGQAEAHDSSVLVLNGAEVNRVLDYAQNGLRRVINAVVSQVNADMLTYSSYDAMVYGSDAQSVKQSLTPGFRDNGEIGADPQGLGNPPDPDLGIRKPTTPNGCAVPRALDHSSRWKYQLGARGDQEILVAPRADDGGPGYRVHFYSRQCPVQAFA